MSAEHPEGESLFSRAAVRGLAAFVLALAFGCLGVGPLSAGRPAAADEAAVDGWLTNFEEAMAVSRRSGLPVLVVFTGSDWCPHCKTLEQNVLFTDTFREWSAPNVVLLMIDLPQNGISQAVRSERSQVCIKYGVRTFPSVLLIASDGTKLAAQTGYTGQSANAWVAKMAPHLPPAVAENDGEKVLDSLDEAVESARGAKRPILLVVARPGDSVARSHSASLMNDPEFGSFAHNNFVVARVPPTADSGSDTSQSMENLLGGAELPSEGVELIVTDDGQTPLFSQSGRQPPVRLINGLKRFLAARQAARTGDSQTR